MIDRYHLRYFLAVIDHGNFTKAAHACNVSQSTLSIGIAKLEKSLGKELYNRTNRRVELTAAGGRLLSHARDIEERFALAERDVTGTEIAATIRIGVLTTTPKIWIEEFLSAHHKAGSRERIEIVEGRERDLRDRLVRGRIDIALTIVPKEPDGAEFETLFTEGYSLALATGHPLADRSIISAEELVNEAMILRRQCELLPETSRYFTARRVRPFFPARTMSDDRALGYVRAGLGITVMPDCFVATGIVRPKLEDFTFTRTLGLRYGPHVNRASLLDNNAITLFIKTIVQTRLTNK